MARATMAGNSGNIQQRVFDAIPVYPVPISIVGLRAALSNLDPESLRHAIRRLREAGYIEAAPNTRFSYRRVPGVSVPADGRGWPKGRQR